MSVFTTLTREHRLFEELIQRLERSLLYDPNTARTEVRKTLLVLLPALKRHEEIEDLIFGNPAYASVKGAKPLLSAVEIQHRRIERLRDDIKDALALTDDFIFADLRALVLELGKRLRAHMTTEETRLWPHYNRSASRSLSSSMDRRGLEKVKALEKEVRSSWEQISDYLGARR